ncbi:MAG: hypothetical protein ABH950_04485 [Candidatus Altiarchaeota archaeon]
MKPLRSDFQLPSGFFPEELNRLINTIKTDEEFDSLKLRERFLEKGHEIRRLPSPKTRESSFLAVDSSSSVKAYRYQTLWGLNVIGLYASHDGRLHHDPLIGQKGILYGGLQVDSGFKLGVFQSAWNLDLQISAIRCHEELKFMRKCIEDMSTTGIKPDFLLVDGSLQTIFRYLNSEGGDSKTALETQTILNELLSERKIIGLVEDSHATDISTCFNPKMTNLGLSNLILEPNEYFIVQVGDVFVCYLKLPSKRVDFLPDRKSPPITVRWEFGYPEFVSDLANLVGIWLGESDIVHSQIYPIRVADYLTRKINVGGLLEDIGVKCDFEPSFRDSRQR